MRPTVKNLELIGHSVADRFYMDFQFGMSNNCGACFQWPATLFEMTHNFAGLMCGLNWGNRRGKAVAQASGAERLHRLLKCSTVFGVMPELEEGQ